MRKRQKRKAFKKKNVQEELPTASDHEMEEEEEECNTASGDNSGDEETVFSTAESSKTALFTGSALARKSKKKSGGFQSMGLSYPVLKGILTKGYKVPTPIQRKAIPVIMEGKDVVAMARTGSGKTGAFLIPMFERLKSRTAKVGARALIFSPTRELAMQTLKFTKELGKFTGLKPILVLGGEKMEEQFAAIHENPDIIIATPGRFLHLVIEMDLKLTSVEYVVFDEADRLFEMGFQEQIEEVLHRLPEHRQTLMFSATLPRLLVNFVKAGLTDPVLIRLDLELKLSENLKTIYLCCRPNDKPAILLHLLKNVVNISEQLTVVFLATRHHIEYIKDVLFKASIPCSYIYSSLDQAARKIHVAKFKSRKVGVLLVTDIAARGIDIPLLDNVINYNFPAKPKLFVHRVGRVARAGRSGTAYSLVSPDELPYLIDLHLFLGKPLTFAGDGTSDQDGICGSVPQSLIDDETDLLTSYHETSVDLRNMTKVCENAYKQYAKSRPAPSNESVKRVKHLLAFSDKIHPIFIEKAGEEVKRSKFLAGMRNYRPNTTIFEIGATGKSHGSMVMRQKRQHHRLVEKIRSVNLQNTAHGLQDQEEQYVQSSSSGMIPATEKEIQAVFPSSLTSKQKSETKQKDFKDMEHYVSYVSSEHYTEKGLGLQGSFEQDASAAILDFTADDTEGTKKMKSLWQWDRKKKRFIKDDGSEMKKKMKTESGVWIPKSYKSDLYKKWQEKHKISFQQDDDDDDGSQSRNNKFRKVNAGGKRKFKNQNGGRQRREIKTKEEILKERRRKGRILAHQKRRQAQKAKRLSSKRKK